MTKLFPIKNNTMKAAKPMDPIKISIKELTPALWNDLEELFGEKGACGGCWCMYMRIGKGEKWADVKGSEAKHRLKAMVKNGTVRGLLAYSGKEPIGWCTFGKRTDFDRLNRARTLKCDDAESVCSIPCFYIKNRYRKQGVASELLKAAVALLEGEGQTILEGYPVKPTKPGNKNIPGPFAWTGTIPMFEKQGFTLAGSPSTSKLRYRRHRATSSDIERDRAGSPRTHGTEN
jgi:predicted GNAT family acetyltransferase